MKISARSADRRSRAQDRLDPPCLAEMLFTIISVYHCIWLRMRVGNSVEPHPSGPRFVNRFGEVFAREVPARPPVEDDRCNEPILVLAPRIEVRPRHQVRMRLSGTCGPQDTTAAHLIFSPPFVNPLRDPLERVHGPIPAPPRQAAKPLRRLFGASSTSRSPLQVGEEMTMATHDGTCPFRSGKMRGCRQAHRRPMGFRTKDVPP
jgi:hypothetical protein